MPRSSDVTKIGDVFLVNGIEFRLKKFRMTKNSNVLGKHNLTFVIEVERDVYAEKKKEEEKRKRAS